MPETPEELHARVEGRAAACRRSTSGRRWPFVGELRPKTLDPLSPEPAMRRPGRRRTARRAAQADEEYLWTDERWRLLTAREPSGLPVIVLLEPRAHHASMADLPEDLARDMG